MSKKSSKYIKYKPLIVVALIALFIVLLFFLFSKIVLPLSTILVFAGLLYISIYYPKKKKKKKGDKDDDDDDEEEITIIIVTKEDEVKKKEEVNEKVKDNSIAIDIKTVKDEHNKDKVIAIDVVSIKEDKPDKEIKTYIKQDGIKDKTLFENNISKEEYKVSKSEKEVITKISDSFKELKKNPVIITKSKEDAKKINKLLKKNSIDSKPTFITVKKDISNYKNDNRSVNAKRVASTVFKTHNKEIKENKIEPVTEKEKITCAHIKLMVKDKEDVKFSKDKDGYINVIGSGSRFRLKLNKKNNYAVMPKEEVKDIKIDKEECSEEENKKDNVRVVLHKIKDILIIKNPIVKLLKRKELIQEKREEYSFTISEEEAKRIIKLEKENKRLLNKLENINKNANVLHDNKNYVSELKLLNKGINKLKDKNINITNLVIRRNNLIKFLNQEKEKQKELKKVKKDN